MLLGVAIDPARLGATSSDDYAFFSYGCRSITCLKSAPIARKSLSIAADGNLPWLSDRLYSCRVPNRSSTREAPFEGRSKEKIAPSQPPAR